jgi:hypothetical protein
MFTVTIYQERQGQRCDSWAFAPGNKTLPLMNTDDTDPKKCYGQGETGRLHRG